MHFSDITLFKSGDHKFNVPRRNEARHMQWLKDCQFATHKCEQPMTKNETGVYMYIHLHKHTDNIPQIKNKHLHYNTEATIKQYAHTYDLLTYTLHRWLKK